LDDAQRCVDLQRTIWEDSEEDLTPSAIFIVANKIGGQALIARDGQKPVGFTLAFPGFRGNLRYLHSHIVGVLPEYQNHGLGRQLKCTQRELALQKGISQIEWTFDPLVMRNAFFNIVRLGAIMRRFHADLYGRTQSPLHSGLPTDRLVAEWQLNSPRVERALSGNPSVPSVDSHRIVVPVEMENWRVSGAPQAAQVQAKLKDQFQQHFADGFAVTGFRLEDGNGIYLLERQER
jgi:predicted GNAT superfamily acetyltransferase